MIPDIPAGPLPGADLAQAIPHPGEPTEYAPTLNATTAPLEAHPEITGPLKRAAEGEPKRGNHDRQGDFLRPIL